MGKINGIIYVILASIAFGIMPIWVKLAYATGLSAYDVMFLRTLLAVVFLYIMIKVQKVDMSIEKEQVWILILVAISYSGAILSLYLSYNYISVGVATALHYLYPVAVMLIALIFFKEKFYSAKWFALLLSLIGVFLMTALGQMEFDPYGVFTATLSAVLFAIYAVSINQEKIKSLHSYILTFYVCLISSGILAIMLVAQGEFPPTITFKGLYYVSLVALICTSIAVMLFIRGVKIIGPTSASILSTLEPIVSLVGGIIILQEVLTWQVVLGSLMVIFSVLLLTVTETKMDLDKEKDELSV